MQLKYIFYLAIIMLLSSCAKENLDNFGKYYVYMSKDTASVTLRDTLFVVNNDTLDKEITLSRLGVSRSGWRETNPGIGVTLQTKASYVDSLVAIFNNTTIPTSAKSSLVLFVGNNAKLPSTCFSMDTVLNFELNKYTVPVNLKLKLKDIARLKGSVAYTVPVFLATTNSPSDTIKTTKRYCVLKIKPSFVIKKTDTVNP